MNFITRLINKKIEGKKLEDLFEALGGESFLPKKYLNFDGVSVSGRGYGKLIAELYKPIQKYKQDSSLREFTNTFIKYVFVGSALMYIFLNYQENNTQKQEKPINKLKSIEERINKNSIFEHIPNTNLAKIDIEGDGKFDAVIGPAGSRSGTYLITEIKSNKK